MIRNLIIGRSVPTCHLLSPDQKHFQGRKAALKYLIAKKYPEEEIEGMRNCMKNDGWLENLKLPTKWFYKLRNDHSGAAYLDSEGNNFESKDAVFRFYQSLENKEEIEAAIKDFTDSQAPIYNKGKDIDKFL